VSPVLHCNLSLLCCGYAFFNFHATPSSSLTRSGCESSRTTLTFPILNEIEGFPICRFLCFFVTTVPFSYVQGPGALCSDTRRGARPPASFPPFVIFGCRLETARHARLTVSLLNRPPPQYSSICHSGRLQRRRTIWSPRLLLFRSLRL